MLAAADLHPELSFLRDQRDHCCVWSVNDRFLQVSVARAEYGSEALFSCASPRQKRMVGGCHRPRTPHSEAYHQVVCMPPLWRQRYVTCIPSLVQQYATFITGAQWSVVHRLVPHCFLVCQPSHPNKGILPATGVTLSIVLLLHGEQPLLRPFGRTQGCQCPCVPTSLVVCHRSPISFAMTCLATAEAHDGLISLCCL